VQLPKKHSLQASLKSKVFVGDEALDDLVDEEFAKNSREEKERFTSASQGSSWLG